MEGIINTLRQQHWEIRSSCDALNSFCKSGINVGDDMNKYIGEQKNVIFHLKKFKKILLVHLKLEDDELYPALLKSKDKKIKETASKFSDEMVLI